MSRIETMARFIEAEVGTEENKVIGRCEGCKEDIHEYDERFDYNQELVHNDADCIRSYFKKIAVLIA